MRNKLPIALSLAALVVALLGAVPVAQSHGVFHAIFAHRAGAVDGKSAVAAGATLNRAAGKLVATKARGTDRGKFLKKFIPKVDSAVNADNAANVACSSCVASSEISDEAGVATLVGQVGVPIPDPAGVLISKTINVPGPGKVIAMVTGSVFISGLAAPDNYLIRLKLNSGSTADATEDGYVTFLRDTDSGGGTRMLPFAVSRDFGVASAGAFTVNLTGWLQVDPGGTVSLDDRVMTLLYVPTDY